MTWTGRTPIVPSNLDWPGRLTRLIYPLMGAYLETTGPVQSTGPSCSGSDAVEPVERRAEDGEFGRAVGFARACGPQRGQHVVNLAVEQMPLGGIPRLEAGLGVVPAHLELLDAGLAARHIVPRDHCLHVADDRRERAEVAQARGGVGLPGGRRAGLDADADGRAGTGVRARTCLSGM